MHCQATSLKSYALAERYVISSIVILYYTNICHFNSCTYMLGAECRRNMHQILLQKISQELDLAES